MNWILGISILIITIYLINHQLKKRKFLKLKKELENNWGKVKKDDFYNFEIIEQYFKNSENKKDAYHIISNQIKNDLDINDLFQYLDRTSSKIGQQYLYYKIRVVENQDKLFNFDKLTEIFETDKKLRLECQLELSKLNSNYAYDLEKLINDEVVEKPKYQKFLIPLSVLAILSISFGFVNPIFFLFLLPIFMVNLVLHYKTKSYISYYLNGVNQLNKALKVSQIFVDYEKIKNHFTSLGFIKKVQEIRLKTKFISFEKQLDNDFVAIIWSIVELIKIQFNIETIIFYSFIDDIVEKRKNIDDLFQFIGEIDSAISVASIKHQNNFICKPNFVSEKKLNIKEIIHPLIEDCVSNNIDLNGKSLLLTGSNMSGKTTFIRMVAINSIIAQTLNIAFAKEFSIPFYKVYSSIRITDDLLDDTSYYLKEVLTIKELIDTSNDKSPCLFVLDEIFKGTNTIERISGGKAILSYLNNENNFVFVSTHDIELTELLENDNFELHHFSEQIMNNELFFDHKLKKGKLKTRNAIKILELYQYPKEIIKDAQMTERSNFG